MDSEGGAVFMPKHTAEFKLEVVRSILDSGLSLREAEKKYQIDKGVVQEWSAIYKIHGIEGLNKKHFSYSGEFKQRVVEDMRTNKLSYREIAAKYNLGGHSIAEKWERIYIENGPEGLYLERRGRVSSSPGTNRNLPQKLDKKVEEDLITENQRLRMENEYLKKLNALVLEREISERKKKLK